jgi:hypothetical protein
MVRNKSSLLIDEPPLMVLPSLAKALGLNEAIFVQQLHWLLQHSGKKVKGQEGVWVYNTFSEWQERFTFWSESTIKRVVTELKKAGILRVGRFNRMQLDQTRWYSLDYEALNKKTPIGSDWHDGLGQVDTMTLGQSDPMLPKSKTTNQRTKTEAANDTPPAPAPTPEPLPLTEKAVTAPPSSAPPPKPAEHPYVQAYREVFQRYPPKAQMARIAKMAVTPPGTEQFKCACESWLMKGFRPTNIDGILEWYRDGVPSYQNGKGRRRTTVPAEPYRPPTQAEIDAARSAPTLEF